MKQLSLKQAQACENALHPTCKCRCGGALHGAKRGGLATPGREFFEALPEGDPHYLNPKKKGKKCDPVQKLLVGLLDMRTSTEAQITDIYADWKLISESTANVALLDTDATRLTTPRLKQLALW